MLHATYDFRTESRGHVDVLVILDQQLPNRRTVLADIEYVLDELLQSLTQPLRSYLILCGNTHRRAPDNVWMGVELQPQSMHAVVFDLQETDYDRAIDKLIARDAVGEGGENITL